eukprot:6050338-Heterocapsa_arctica.AAC.1
MSQNGAMDHSNTFKTNINGSHNNVNGSLNSVKGSQQIVSISGLDFFMNRPHAENAAAYVVE